MSKGTESLEDLPASTHPVEVTLSIFADLAKRYFAAGTSSLRNCEQKNPVISAEIASGFQQPKTFIFKNGDDLQTLRIADFHDHGTILFEMGGCLRGDDAVGLQPILSTIQSAHRIK